jgi:hypothetical protein
MSNTTGTVKDTDLSKIQEWANQSRFIFKCEISGFKDKNNNIAIAKVIEFFEAPNLFANYVGKELRVQLSSSQTIKEGQQRVIFAKPWLYGESITVQEVGQFEVQGETSSLHKQVTDTIQNLADKKLQQHLDEINIVVLGKVSQINEVETSDSDEGHENEPLEVDAPLYFKAIVEVEDVIKGKLSDKHVEVLFNNNLDKSNYNTPKFKPGQEGIFLLHKQQIKELNMEAFTALDPTDFQPKDQLAHIEAIVRSSSRQV